MATEDGVTYIEEVNVYQCNYCGAYAVAGIVIEHYPTCTRHKGAEQYEEMAEFPAERKDEK